MFLLSGAIGLVGFLFVVGNQGLTRRMIVGVILLALALAVAGFAARGLSRSAAATARKGMGPAQVGASPWPAAAEPVEPIELVPDSSTQPPTPPGPTDSAHSLTADESACRQCGMDLPPNAFQNLEGGLFAHCPQCGTFYRVREAPEC